MHPTNKNSVIAFNLGSDPRALLSLSVDELKLRLFTRTEDLPEGVERLALKEIHLNKTPMLLPPSMLDDATAERLAIDKVRAEQHWQILRNLSLSEQQLLQQTLFQLYSGQEFADKTDPEQMLYSGFFEDHDKRLMMQVRRAGPEFLAGGSFDFRDSRLKELLFRYRARNFPDSLTAQERERWKAFCRWRLTSKEAQAGLTLAEFDQRLRLLTTDANINELQQNLLKQLAVYADKLKLML